ncbi:MAG TPA: DUF669 domain-containing protein [Phycisphaerae bacterium]|nr:DUF669 domain-containing protein [Phycisphaerae bacterium]
MANLNGFDANTVEPTTEFDPVPAGKYLAVVAASEMKPTKNGKGSYLELQFQIIEGEHANRNVWARLNLDNPNPQAVQIARAQLSAVCRAVGVMTPKDSYELHNLPLVIDVKCKKRQDNDEITNEIKAFSKKEAPAASARPAASSTPPWARR